MKNVLKCDRCGAENKSVRVLEDGSTMCAKCALVRIDGWTKGPWHVERGEYEDKDVVYVCHPETNCPDTVVCSFINDDCGEELANAHLIAAAPEMYEALRAVEAWENPTCFEKVKAALKKARGEA